MEYKIIKIKILEVTNYDRATRDIEVGDTYDVISIGFSEKNDRKTCYLFESKNGKMSLAYDGEVKVIK